MIRINLLPTGAVAAGTNIKAQLIVAGVAIVLSLSGILFIPNFGVLPLNARVESLEKEIDKAKQELQKVQKYRKQLEQIKKFSKQIKKKLEIIAEIEKKRTGPVWLMDELTDAVSHFPIADSTTGRETKQYLKNKVFITRFNVQGKMMALEGMAINNTFLVAFMNNLKKKNKLFQNVTLFFSDQTEYHGALVRKFKITATVLLTAKAGESSDQDNLTEEAKKGGTGI